MKQIGTGIVSTIIFGCLLYMIVNSGWQLWICWVTGIFTVLLWAFFLFLTWLWFIIEKQIMPGIKSGWKYIKEEYGVNSVPEFIMFLWEKLLYIGR